MMNRRLLLIVVGVAVIIGVLGVTFTLWRRSNPQTNTNATPTVISNTNASVTPEDTARTREAALIRSASVKVSEAWGSGPIGESNQRLIAVVSDLTDNLRVFAEAQAKRPQVRPDPEKLDAARALTEKIADQSEDRATVEVTLQILTTTVPTPPNAGSPEVSYRKLKLGFQKVGDAWKVSEVTDLGRVEL